MEGGNWKRAEEAAGPSSGGSKQEMPQNSNEAFLEEEQEEEEEAEEEEEEDDTDHHKNTNFVPGPLLPLKDQIERDKVFSICFFCPPFSFITLFKFWVCLKIDFFLIFLF